MKIRAIDIAVFYLRRMWISRYFFGAG